MKQVLASLGLVAMLGMTGCAPLDGYFSRVFVGMGSIGGSWSGPIAGVPNDSVTVQRVRAGGGAGGVERVLPEEGDVWPAEEGPRATLANPDEALRGIPTYRPGAETNTPLPAPATAPRRAARGSGAAFEPPPDWQPPAQPVPSGVPATQAAPRQPLPGSTVNAGGANRTITGSTGGVSTTVGPSGQSGVLLGRPGEVQILQEPGRPAQQILPRP